jgi:hypothetical protein
MAHLQNTRVANALAWLVMAGRLVEENGPVAHQQAV